MTSLSEAARIRVLHAWSSGRFGLTIGLVPGLTLTGLLAGMSLLLRHLPGLALFSPMILAILMGIGLAAMLPVVPVFRPGLAFAARRLLRLAIVLIGLQLTFRQVQDVGLVGLAVIVVAMATTFVFTIALGRVLGVEARLAQLIAAGTSICGASAVASANTVARAGDEDVAYAIGCVTIFGTVAMLAAPLAGAALGLSPRAYGLWTGATIHEIAQVVAAAYQGGAEAGEFGLVAKLTRVMLLAPMVFALGAWLRRGVASGGAAATRVPVPWFVFGFIGLVAVNSLMPVTAATRAAAGTVTTLLLTMALAALGLQTDLAKMRIRGPRPLLLGLAAFLFIAILGLMLVLAMTGWDMA